MRKQKKAPMTISRSPTALNFIINKYLCNFISMWVKHIWHFCKWNCSFFFKQTSEWHTETTFSTWAHFSYSKGETSLSSVLGTDDFSFLRMRILVSEVGCSPNALKKSFVLFSYILPLKQVSISSYFFDRKRSKGLEQTEHSNKSFTFIEMTFFSDTPRFPWRLVPYSRFPPPVLT